MKTIAAIAATLFLSACAPTSAPVPPQAADGDLAIVGATIVHP